VERELSNLGSRVFLLRNVHETETVLFQTRWTLSYLRGPMTLPHDLALAVLTEQVYRAATIVQGHPYHK